MAQVSLFSLTSGHQILANVIDEDEDNITTTYPLTITTNYSLNGPSSVYAVRYMPFAKDNIVQFSKYSLAAVSIPNNEMVKYYNDLVDQYKNKPAAKYEGLDGDAPEEARKENKQESSLYDVLYDALTKKTDTFH